MDTTHNKEIVETFDHKVVDGFHFELIPQIFHQSIANEMENEIKKRLERLIIQVKLINLVAEDNMVISFQERNDTWRYDSQTSLIGGMVLEGLVIPKNFSITYKTVWSFEFQDGKIIRATHLVSDIISVILNSQILDDIAFKSKQEINRYLSHLRDQGLINY